MFLYFPQINIIPIPIRFLCEWAHSSIWPGLFWYACGWDKDSIFERDRGQEVGRQGIKSGKLSLLGGCPIEQVEKNDNKKTTKDSNCLKLTFLVPSNCLRGYVWQTMFDISACTQIFNSLGASDLNLQETFNT